MKNTPRTFLALAAGSLLAVSSAPAQTTYTWANSNVTGTPPANLDWFTGGPNTQGTWTGGDPVSSNLNTIQFFENTTSALPNTAVPSTQAVNLNNGGTAFQLGTLTLSGRASATTNANLTMNHSGDALNFSAATGTINLNSVNNTRSITFNVANNIQLGTATSASTLTLTGSGNNTFNFSGSVSELQAGGGGKLIKSGSSTATLSGAVTVSGGVEVNAGTLALTSAANNITGGFTLNGGALRFSNAATINDKNITVTGAASLLVGVNANLSTNASILLNAGANLSLGGDNGSLTITSAVTGDGSITASRVGSSGHTQILSSTANTFKGTISFTQGATVSLTVNSLVDSDSPGAGNIRFAEPNSTQTFALGSGAIAPLTLNNRRIELVTAPGGTAIIQNNSSQAFTINPDLLVTAASGTRTLQLGGTGAGLSSFNGAIANGALSSLALTKSGSGTWTISGNMSNTGGVTISGGTLRLSGTNTYSGNTNFNAGGTTLTFAGLQAVSPNTTFVMNTNASTADATVRFLDDTGGVNGGSASVPNTFTQQNSNAPGNAKTFFVGNNNTGNGGTSIGTTTGSTIAIGTLNWNTYAAGTTAYGPMNITGANGYRFQVNSVVLHNAANLTSGTVGQTTFNPTTANVTLGTVTVGTGNVNQGYQTLVLDGTSSDNRITGAISNAPDFGTSNRELRVTKSNTSTWTLSGANTYTGATTITAGKLVFSGANALPTAGTISVGASGHLSVADGAARSQTVSALTLTSLASMSLDWTGNNTGDQLTSTADITPAAGSHFAINLNRSGTPGGSVTLLAGGAGSTLDASNYYLANLTDYTATLSKTASTVSVGGYSSQAALTTLYWMGNQVAAGGVAGVDNSWALSSGTASNWSSSDGTYAATALTPGSTANVVFSSTLSGRAQQSTVLGMDVTVNSVVIADGTAVTIGGANGATLTLMSSLSTPGLVDGTPGGAITVTSTANATSTISSKVNLGSNQTWNVAGGKTLAVSGEVSGGFSLTKADPGTVILSGTNTYYGDTTISAGTLRIGNNTAGTLGAGNYAGNIFNNGTLQIWSTATQILSGVISGPGNLQKAYGGTLTLAGNNTYTGQTLLQPQTTAGFTLFVSSFNSVVGGTASSSLGAPTTVANGTIELGSGGAQAGVNITYTGPGETTDRVINFAMNGTGATKTLDASGAGLLKFTSTFTKSGSNTNDVTLQGTGNGEIVGGLDFVFRNFLKSGPGTWTLGGNLGHTGTTAISGGTLELNSGATLGGGTYANTITFSNSSTLRYNSTASQSLDGVISGAGSLVKDNTATLTLSNANTYTGATTVSAGTLLVNGAHTGGGLITVSAGAALGGTGTMGNVTVDDLGVLAPGTSPGQMTVGNLTLNDTSVLRFELGAPTLVPDPGFSDHLVVNGHLMLNGRLQITALAGFPGAPLPTDKWLLMSYSGTLTDNKLELDSPPPGGYYIDTATEGSVFLAVVPEAGTATLFGLGVLILRLLRPQRARANASRM